MATLKKEIWTIDRHGPVHVYLPDDLRPEERLPLVLDMNCTTGSPQAEVRTNGWDVAAAQNRLVVFDSLLIAQKRRATFHSRA